MLDLYRNIRKRREALGLSQEELAQKMGYKSRSSINKIEMGGNDIPQSKIEAFAKALETTPAALMGWDVEELSKKERLLEDRRTWSEEKRKAIELVENGSDEDAAFIAEMYKRYMNGGKK